MNKKLIKLSKLQHEKIDAFAKLLAKELSSDIEDNKYSIDKLNCLVSLVHSEAVSRIGYELSSEILYKAKDFQ